MINLNDFVETRTCKYEAFIFIGFSGESMDEEKNLFKKLNERMDEIANIKSNIPYLAVSGKNPIPFVGVEVTDSRDVPSGMDVLSIPAEEYVAFKFMKKNVGDFWDKVCTIENQTRYNIDLSKPRFEMFNPDQQSAEFLEWYIPTF